VTIANIEKGMQDKVNLYVDQIRLKQLPPKQKKSLQNKAKQVRGEYKTHIQQTDFIRAVWKAIKVNITIAHKKETYQDLGPFIKYMNWVAERTLNKECEVVIKELKALSLTFRKWVVTKQWKDHTNFGPKSFIRLIKSIVSSPDQRAQIARISRCLPIPPAPIIEQAIRDYQKIVTQSPQPVDENLIDELWTFGKDFARGAKTNLKYHVTWTPNETTSSFNNSRQEGGRFTDLISNSAPLLQFFTEWVQPAKDEPSEFLDTIVYESALLTDEQQEIYHAKVIAVPEPGYKTRVLMKFPAANLVRSDQVRRQLWPLIKKEINFDLDKIPSEKLIQELLEKSLHQSGVCISSDLRNATDYIPHHYAQAVWGGLLSEFDAPDHIRDHITKMFSPIIVHKDDGTTFITKRGIQMGTPLSFMTLCLLHSFCVRDSGNNWAPYLIRGDDLIGIFKYVNLYQESLVKVGFMINKQKTIISNYGGIFTEKTILFQRTEKIKRFPKARQETTIYDLIKQNQKYTSKMVISSAKRVNDVPTMGLLHPDPQQTVLRSLGQTCGYLKSTLPLNKTKLLMRVISIAQPDVIDVAIKLNLPIHTPQELGGVGIPNKHGVYKLDMGFKLRSKIGYAASHADGARNFRHAIRQQPGNLREQGFDSIFMDIIEKKSKDSKSSSTYETDPMDTEYYRAMKRRWQIERHVPATNEILTNNGETTTITIPGTEMTLSFTDEGPSYHTGPTLVNTRLFIDEQLERVQLSPRTRETTERFKKSAYEGHTDKRIFDEIKKRAKTFYQLNKIEQPRIGKWVKPFQMLKSNKPRWTPKSDSSEEHIHSLINRIKLLSASYIPFSKPPLGPISELKRRSTAGSPKQA